MEELPLPAMCDATPENFPGVLDARLAWLNAGKPRKWKTELWPDWKHISDCIFCSTRFSLYVKHRVRKNKRISQ